MDTKYIQRGRFMGRIDITNSIATMEPGEIWHINPTCVNMQSVRNACSRANSSTDKLFSASCPGFSEPCITVTRIR